MRRGAQPILARPRSHEPARGGGQLPGGWWAADGQMGGVGRARLTQRNWLRLAEPTGGLGRKIMEEVFAHSRAINRPGFGVLMAEQNARRALELADRGYVLAA